MQEIEHVVADTPVTIGCEYVLEKCFALRVRRVQCIHEGALVQGQYPRITVSPWA